MTCPASPPTTAPTTSSDPYLGATITTYNTSGQVAQVTSPLGGITTSSYDADGNLVSETVESTSSPTPAISAVGSPSGHFGSIGASSYNLADSPSATGDLMVLAVDNDTWADTVSSVSGGGVSGWTAASSPFLDGADGQIEQIWYGTVSATGSSHITVNFTGSVNNANILAQEFSAGSGTTWSVDTTATASSPFPSLSAAGTGELYFGEATAYGNAAAGTTAGVSYYVPTSNFLAAWDTNVTGTLAPNGTGHGSLAALLVAHGAASAEPSVTTQYSYNADDQQASATTGYGTSSAATTLSYYDPDGNTYCSVSPKAYAEGGDTCPAWQASWASSVPSVSSLYSGSTPPAAEVSTSFYDADGELLQQSGPDRATSISVYDADGQVACAEDAPDMAATLAAEPTATYPYSCTGFNPAVAPATGSNPGYEETIYDPADLALSSTDAAGGTTAYSYDPDGLVLTSTGPNSQVSTNCYFWEVSTCAAGAPFSGGDATALYSTTSPPAQGEANGITANYAYNPGGATASETTLAGTTTYGYDNAGDTTSVHYGTPASGYGSAHNVSYSYNVAALPTSLTDGAGTTSYAYDGSGDTLSSSFAAGTGTGLTSGTTFYSYTTAGQRATLTYPQAPSGGAATVSYAYDGAGQLSAMTDWAGHTISFGYDPDGNLASVAYPDGTATAATYDLGDAETALSAFTGTPADPGTTLLGISYSPNGAEQVGSEADTGALSASLAYTYSPADRLGSVKVGSGSPAATAYNASGDPTTLVDGTTQVFNSDDQLASATSSSSATESYTYNATGDRTASSGTISGSASYGYNQADELTSATVGSASVSYVYGGPALLAGRTVASTTSTFTWDATAGLPLLLSDGTADYLYGPDGTVVEQAKLSTGAPEYYVSDDQGSTRALLGASGAVDATFSFDAYGNLTSSSGSATTPFLYDGQYEDSASGLYYLRARWYDAATDEFVSVDPDVAQTGTPYGYAGDDPVNQGDPLGLYSYVLNHDLGPVSLLGSAADVMSVFKKYFLQIFPFGITNCSSLSDGTTCYLEPEPPCGALGVRGCGWVKIENVTSTSFEFFVTKKGYFDAPGSHITFTTYVAEASNPNPAWRDAPNYKHDVFLQQDAWGKSSGLQNLLARFLAGWAWGQQATNLANFAFAAHNPGRDPLTWGYSYPPSPTPPAPILRGVEPATGCEG